MMPSFKKALELIEGIDRVYSMDEKETKAIWDVVKKLPAGAVILEIGVCHGRTGIPLAYLCKSTGAKYFGVDDFSLGYTEQELRANFDKHDLPYTFYHCQSQSLSWNEPIDVLIIDGGHSEPHVKPDCEKFIPLIRQGGYLFVHDYVPHPYNAGAHSAIREHTDLNTKGWEDLGFAKGLKILRRGK